MVRTFYAQRTLRPSYCASRSIQKPSRHITGLCRVDWRQQHAAGIAGGAPLWVLEGEGFELVLSLNDRNLPVLLYQLDRDVQRALTKTADRSVDQFLECFAETDAGQGQVPKRGTVTILSPGRIAIILIFGRRSSRPAALPAAVGDEQQLLHQRHASDVAIAASPEMPSNCSAFSD
ncbi:hypothetical protein [Bradyrhizobium sp. CCBAU 21360]|uniref:hypothetical protein n=1 Tax=Bradyrhizobium sp. CCBAU 21360 TaxID=1325081 RepID=UPI00230663D0|nr:hypothetical protein [Bradyrhizobium sp. CCBAU 21360]MDA9446092.1 hypothetical protein [Bradyrhizobium sp. CCBAU 21360]